MLVDNKLIKWGSIILILFILVFLYKNINPYLSPYFPKCPFKVLTGLKCPGCGSQRAIHFLLNFDFINAMKENVILVFLLPYLFIGFVFDLIEKPGVLVLKWRKRLFGSRMIYITFSIIIAFWIIRNL